MVSKKHLAAEVENLRSSLFELVNAVHKHIDAAEALGYEAKIPLPVAAPTSVPFARARLRLLRLADLNALHAELTVLRANAANAEAAASELSASDATVATPTPEYVRRDTLAKVIEALELDQYRDRGAWFMQALGLPPRRDGIDRFWDDLNIALRVRAEDAEAEADEAAEQRIAAITHPTPSPEDEWAGAGETIIDSSGRDL
ncbi:hypothetical protein [Microbacterium sp. T32]|uniref:hypothetical protein n=1 Tax=Microbacterium sp. T32 TaxID=1776083 RepID=UPI0007AB89B5|nr:hypothetical protein [Microbacterium sp. T32]KZE41370.1 hypothetical protein AVW09_01940 [Microbacterium sp. T32]